jgi:hypothetical protein
VEYSIEFGGDPSGVTFTTSGQADLAVILRANDEFLADGRFRPGMPVLADHSALDTTPLSSADAKLIGDAYRRFLEHVGKSAVAIVVGHPASFGLVRMAEAYAGAPESGNVGIFYSRDDAIGWLRNPISQ